MFCNSWFILLSLGDVLLDVLIIGYWFFKLSWGLVYLMVFYEDLMLDGYTRGWLILWGLWD